MKCSKCEAEIPDGTTFCGSCGAPMTAGETRGEDRFSQWWATTAAMAGRDPAALMVGLGGLMLCLGAFLSWISRSGPDVLGVQMAAGPVVLALGAIMVLAMVLARGGTPGAWGIVVLVLSGVCLALIFQEMVYLDDNKEYIGDIGAGVYVAMVGGLATAIGGFLETTRALKK